MSQATDFIATNGNDAADLMEAFAAAGHEGDQDWGNETTAYTFEDGSKIVISGPSVQVV